MDRRNDTQFVHTALIVRVDDLCVLDTEAKPLLLTLLELCDVRALQLQSDLECINGKPVCKILTLSGFILIVVQGTALTPIA